jgi:hypothetical protein
VPADDDNASTDNAADANAEETASERRSRRSRRGGRRRNRGEGGEGDDEPEAPVRVVEEFDFSLPQYIPPPTWYAPRLVPTINELSLPPVETRTDAKLDAAKSKLVIDGDAREPHILFVNTETATDMDVVTNQIKLAAATGIHLFSAVTYLPLKNAYGERSYTRTREVLDQILAADPDAKILLRLQCAPTNYWARMHPGELAKYADGTDGDVSFASAEFWRASVGAIAALLQYLSDPETVGGDHVVGIHLDKGEWFHDAQAGYDFSAPNRRAFQQWLHEKYQNIYALRAAWHDGSVDFDSAEIPAWAGTGASDKQNLSALYGALKDRRYVDYHSYASDIVAEAIVGLAESIKQLTDNRILVGASYGYTFEFAHRNDSGHQSLYKVLASPSIDMLAGPNSYANRTPGGAGAFCSPVDSIRLHGKIWIVEDDTKTHLAAEETEDSYNPRIGTPQDTLAVHRRNGFNATVHESGVNWMDLWGQGWLNNETLWSDIQQYRDHHAAAERMRDLRGTTPPEVAVLVDEASFAYVRSDAAGIALQGGLITKIRDLICRSGASVGFYLQSDVAQIPTGSKVFVFLNALRVTTEERQAIRERLQVAGKTLVWLYAPGLFDERGGNRQEVTEIVGQALKPQPWNSRIGTLFTEERHPIIERLHGGKRMGAEDLLNPSYMSTDPQGAVLGEYIQSGSPSIVARNMPGGWKSVFVGEPHLTGELVRGIFRYAGVHVFDLQDDIVTAANGLLAVHAPYTGQRTLHLPRASAVYSLTENRLVTQQSNTFRAFMRGRSTHFFLFGTIEQLSEAIGLSIDELKATQQAHHERQERERSFNPRGNRDANEDSGESDEGSSEPVEPRAPAVLSDALGDLELPDNVDELPSEEEALGELTTPKSPEDGASTTPSRRRRWNRRHQRSQRPENAAPVSMDDILGGLQQRRREPPQPPQGE